MKENTISRKERIMREALLLFSSKGYMDTSTKEIALKANVSEALIFKHFGNKDSLLSQLIKSGYRRVILQHKDMLTYKNAKDFLRKMIFLPNKLVSEEPQFWRLQERLSHHPFSKSQHEQFMKPVQIVLNKAFVELDYAHPELETQYLLLLIDMLWKKEACGEINNALDISILLEKKYNLI